VRWQKVTLVGVGLLGGSLGMALRNRKLAGSVCGFVRRSRSVRECVTAGAVDLATLDLLEAVTGAELIVLCTPVAKMRPLVKEMLPALNPGTMITDVGSVKSSVVQDLEPLAADARAHFVGSHPMAGSEKTGVDAARSDLFEGAVCVITPTRRSNKGAIRRISSLWRAVGGQLMRLSPEEHDALVSRSSHLPHIVAATLANLVLDPASPREQRLLCAGGFRDSTRIASGSPEMWRDIEIANGKNVIEALDHFIEQLKSVRTLVAKGDQKRIEQFLSQAKQRRDMWRDGGTKRKVRGIP
jgi:prephenate dehydrogenase